jgi:Ni/Co efflux regulator RcnB
MKNLLISAFIFSLATAAPTVLLADDPHHDSAPHGSSGSHGAPSGGGMSSHGTSSSGGHHSTTMDHHTSSGSMGSTHHSTHHTTHHTTAGTGHTTNHMAVHAKIDVSSYHKNFTAPHAYHYGDYHGPAGYSYHRWSYGDNLPREYWAQNYWINNYLNFGLIAPPDGYVWVRYGPDAVLIDEDTGEIVQVEYGVFY